MEAGIEVAPRRRRVRRQVKWGLYAVLLFLILEYLVLPQLAGARKSVNLLGKINVAYVIVGVILEAASLLAYSQLTHTVLHHEGPHRSRLLRVNLSSLSVSHIMPGGTAPGTAVAFRLLMQSGVSGADAGFALGMQGVGSALVLNAILWLALLVSVFIHGYNPLYAVAAGAGVVLMGLFAGLVLALTRGRERSIETLRRWAATFRSSTATSSPSKPTGWPSASGQFLAEPQLLARAIAWAAAFWLLDAASLFVFIAALGKIVSPIDLLVAYGLAQVLAVIPITPSGLGVIEGVLIPTLVGFGVPRETAILGVLGYRLVNFWLPIPVGRHRLPVAAVLGRGLGPAPAPRPRGGGVARRRRPSGAPRAPSPPKADPGGEPTARVGVSRPRPGCRPRAGAGPDPGPGPGAGAGRWHPRPWAPGPRCRWDRGPRSWCRR